MYEDLPMTQLRFIHVSCNLVVDTRGIFAGATTMSAPVFLDTELC